MRRGQSVEGKPPARCQERKLCSVQGAMKAQRIPRIVCGPEPTHKGFSIRDPEGRIYGWRTGSVMLQLLQRRKPFFANPGDEGLQSGAIGMLSPRFSGLSRLDEDRSQTWFLPIEDAIRQRVLKVLDRFGRFVVESVHVSPFVRQARDDGKFLLLCESVNLIGRQERQWIVVQWLR